MPLIWWNLRTEKTGSTILLCLVPKSSTEEDEVKAMEILQKDSDKDIDKVNVTRLRPKNGIKTLPNESQIQRSKRQLESDSQMIQPCPDDRIHEEGL